MNVYVFPGQGAQYPGMGNDLNADNSVVKKYLDLANEILGFDLYDLMINGDADVLKQTHVAQPALFVHSLIRLNMSEDLDSIDAVAGHSLGEFSALAAAKVFDFATGLNLVKARSAAMKEACDSVDGTMAAILGLDDDVIESICNDIPEVVVAANYNSPGQVVISGEIAGVEKASESCKKAGARRVVPLVVGGAFHSPLMAPAELALKRENSKH